MENIIVLAPLFLVFEIWQLVICERYVGIKQIARGADPRTLGLSEITAFFWTSTIVVYWFWMILLLVTPLGRTQGLALLVLSTIGFSLRRSSPFKWILVILTFEGALRIFVLVTLTVLAWHRLR